MRSIVYWGCAHYKPLDKSYMLSLIIVQVSDLIEYKLESHNDSHTIQNATPNLLLPPADNPKA